MSRVLCRIPALVSVIILMMTMVSCAGKKEAPSPEPVPSQTEETDDVSGTG